MYVGTNNLEKSFWSKDLEAYFSLLCSIRERFCRPLMDEENLECITLHKDFPKVCLEPAVLRATLIARGDIRGHDRRGNVPAVLPNG